MEQRKHGFVVNYFALSFFRGFRLPFVVLNILLIILNFINLPLTKMRIMRLLKNDTELRMVLAALMISPGIISLALYDTYSEDLSAKNLPKLLLKTYQNLIIDLAGR